MAELTEHLIERLDVVPLVSDCTTPALADDDTYGTVNAPEGHVATVVGEPNESDVPVWNSTDRKYYPGAAGFVPTFIASGVTYKIPDNMQATFAVTIDTEGTIELGTNSYLTMVD